MHSRLMQQFPSHYTKIHQTNLEDAPSWWQLRVLLQYRACNLEIIVHSWQHSTAQLSTAQAQHSMAQGDTTPGRRFGHCAGYATYPAW